MIKVLSFVLLAMTVGVSSLASAQAVKRVSNVISGKLAISGSTNRSALDDSALRDLCDQGYTRAIFVYSGARARTVSCGGGRTIEYSSMSNWESPGSIVSKVVNEIDGGGKVLLHCWYGVHASKFVAAASLTKLCGFSGSQAAKYFEVGIPPGSLGKARIAELSGKLSGMNGNSHVVSGCPSPR